MVRRRGADRWLRGLGALALVSTGCAREVARAEAATRTVDILALQAQLEVPTTALVEVRERWVRVVMDPGRRSPRTLDIVPIEARRGRSDRGVHLDVALGPAMMRSRIEHDEGGSGGPEARLIGRVGAGAREVEVVCSAQDEDRPSLRWCLDLLQTLRPRQ